MITRDDWDHAPRKAAWTVVRAERVELRSEDGSLLTWTRPDRGVSALYDEAGQLTVTLRPQVKQNFFLRHLVWLAAQGAILLGQNRWHSRNRVSGPPLLVTSTRPQLTVAAIAPTDGGSQVVELLPAGPLNDRLLRRSLAPETVSRLRGCNPLTITTATDFVEQLRDVAGRVFARADYATSEDRHPRSVELVDNALPAIVLYAILVGAHGWHS
jgi:hypothetical protein